MENKISTDPFWKNKSLDQMSASEWEQLCDHCGLCCLVRVQDEDSLQVFDTNVICSQYDCENTQCKSYSNRETLDEGCVQLTPMLVRQFDWLPDSCAYRVVDRGENLPDTHPLVSLQNDTTATVVDIFEPIGLVVNSEDVDPEQYIQVSDDEYESS